MKYCILLQDIFEVLVVVEVLEVLYTSPRYICFWGNIWEVCGMVGRSYVIPSFPRFRFCRTLETWFLISTSRYINRTNFFDVHPPLGKMLIAGFGDIQLKIFSMNLKYTIFLNILCRKGVWVQRRLQLLGTKCFLWRVPLHPWNASWLHFCWGSQQVPWLFFTYFF